jgi:MFS superfamily sulfate permease-like transporter
MKKHIQYVKNSFAGNPNLGDLKSGLLVALMALPLSLGIAKASGFPPALGIISAIVGGLVTGIAGGSAITIKGPAAGLITIVSAALLAFNNSLGTVAAILCITAVLQFILGRLKLGALSSVFPNSVVHGMLASIGLIIIAKQIPVLLGVDPLMYAGKNPIPMFLAIPSYFQASNPTIAAVGMVSLVLLFILSNIRGKLFKTIPPALIVITATIGLSIYLHLNTQAPSFALVQIGDWTSLLVLKPDFSKIGTILFWKFVLLFLFVSSLESLLTVKAFDFLKTGATKTNSNKDLEAQGIGNFILGLIGGLPIISEVVRTTANVGFGGKTAWANFFHGLFLLIFMVILIPVIEWIPNAALAALLIFAGFRLTSPKQYFHTYQVGKEQLALFLVTIVVTLASDLLMGVLAGIILKFVLHLFQGVKPAQFFQTHVQVDPNNKQNLLILGPCVFSSILFYQRVFNRSEANGIRTLDFSQCPFVDHSFMSYLQQYQVESGLEFKGLNNLKPLSDHTLAARRLI